MASSFSHPPKPYPIKIRIHGSDREDLLTQVGEWWHNADPAFRAGKWCFGLEKQEILHLAYRQKAFGSKGYVPIDVSSALASVSTGLPVGLVYPHQESYVPILLKSDNAGHDTSTLEEAIVFRQGGGYSLADDIATFHSAHQLTSHHSINGRPCLYLVATNGSAEDERNLENTLKDLFSNLDVEAVGASSTQKAPLLRVQSSLPYCAFFAALSVFALLRRMKALALIVAIAIPTATGSILALSVSSQSWGLMAWLGTIIAHGLMLNQAVLMATKLRSISQNRSLTECALNHSLALTASTRFDPIMTTTLATVCGLMPLFLFGDALWKPFAASLFGGILGSCLGVLWLLPVWWKQHILKHHCPKEIDLKGI